MPLPLMFSHGGTSSLPQTPRSLLPGEGMIGAFRSVWGASLVAQWLGVCLPVQGDTGSSPGLGGSHMPRSDWARGPQLLSLRVWSLRSTTREAAIVRGPHTVMKSGPRLPQLEKALSQKRRPNTAKNK